MVNKLEWTNDATPSGDPLPEVKLNTQKSEKAKIPRTQVRMSWTEREVESVDQFMLAAMNCGVRFPRGKTQAVAAAAEVVRLIMVNESNEVSVKELREAFQNAINLSSS